MWGGVMPPPAAPLYVPLPAGSHTDALRAQDSADNLSVSQGGSHIK